MRKITPLSWSFLSSRHPSRRPRVLNGRLRRHSLDGATTTTATPGVMPRGGGRTDWSGSALITLISGATSTTSIIGSPPAGGRKKEARFRAPPSGMVGRRVPGQLVPRAMVGTVQPRAGCGCTIASGGAIRTWASGILAVCWQMLQAVRPASIIPTRASSRMVGRSLSGRAVPCVLVVHLPSRGLQSESRLVGRAIRGRLVSSRMVVAGSSRYLPGRPS